MLSPDPGAAAGTRDKNARRALRRASLPRQRVGPSGPRAWRSAFVRAYARCGNISAAAEHVGLSPTTAYAAIKRDDSLRPALDQARDEYADRCESLVDARAFHGVPRPVYQGGALVGHTTEYSDKLAELRLRALRPSTYTQGPAVGAGSGNVSFTVNLGISTRDGDPRPPAARRPVLDVAPAPPAPSPSLAPRLAPRPPCLPATGVTGVTGTAATAPQGDTTTTHGDDERRRAATPAPARPPAPGSAPARAPGPPSEMQAPPLSLHPDGAPVGPPHALFLGTNGSPLEVGGWIEGIEVEGGGTG